MVTTFGRAGIDENNTLKKQTDTRNADVGFIKPFAGNTVPDGYLYCDGSAVSRSTYADLFAVLGTTAGSGDGSSTFNLPDLRNVWTVGAGTNAVLADVAEGLPEIQGELDTRPDTVTASAGAFVTTDVTVSAMNRAAQGGTGQIVEISMFNASRYNSIYGASSHVTPASVALTPCIVYE